MDYILYGAELVGTVAFALSGAVLAVRKGLDLFGVLFLGVMAALGGGTIRDLLLGRTPPRMFYKVEYVALSLAAALLVFLAAKLLRRTDRKSTVWTDTLFLLCDALGLGIFAVIGTEAGISAGYGENPFLCIFLGMTTGVGGGILRDIMCMDVPAVLRKHIYAVAAIAGGGTFYCLTTLGIGGTLPSFAGMGVTVLLRMLASHYKWNLPRADHALR